MWPHKLRPLISSLVDACFSLLDSVSWIWTSLVCQITEYAHNGSTRLWRYLIAGGTAKICAHLPMKVTTTTCKRCKQASMGIHTHHCKNRAFLSGLLVAQSRARSVE